MNYNTQRGKMPLPEYGRAIQDMVNYALDIQDRTERERCAYTIVNIMGNMFPTPPDVPDFKNKLWDHLAYMSDYKLDIDYPCQITRLDKSKENPDNVKYPSYNIKYRHYGRIIPDQIKIAMDLPEGPMRDQLIRLLAVQMKKNLLLWNKELFDDNRVLEDIKVMSKGTLQVSESDLNIGFPQPQSRPYNKNRKKNKKKF